VEKTIVTTLPPRDSSTRERSAELRGIERQFPLVFLYLVRPLAGREAALRCREGLTLPWGESFFAVVP
jgi:hypothetical protein